MAFWGGGRRGSFSLHGLGRPGGARRAGAPRAPPPPICAPCSFPRDAPSQKSFIPRSSTSDPNCSQAIDSALSRSRLTLAPSPPAEQLVFSRGALRRGKTKHGFRPCPRSRSATLPLARQLRPKSYLCLFVGSSRAQRPRRSPGRPCSLVCRSAAKPAAPSLTALSTPWRALEILKAGPSVALRHAPLASFGPPTQRSHVAVDLAGQGPRST